MARRRRNRRLRKCLRPMREPNAANKPGSHRFAFVLDQQVGLKTLALNMEAVVLADSSITPTIVPVRYEAPTNNPLLRLPGVPESIKGTLRGVGEIKSGLGNGKAFDGLFWLSWAAKSVPDLVKAAPSFLMMDMTPTQMEQMGELYGYSRARSRFMGGWKKKASLHLYEVVEHLFPWSDWAAQSLHNDYNVPLEKITVVSPGVDTDLYRPARENEKPNDGVCRFLFVGGDFERKGGDLLLRWAWETKTKPWEIHLVTRDPVSETPGVHVYHNVSNNSDTLLSLYRKCDVLVLPTRADCYSLVGMEAQASGLPVIISNLAGIPDVVADKETGLLLPPGDHDALAACLDHVVENPALRQTMGRAARNRAERLFDCRVNLGGILAAMKAAAREKPGHG